MEEDGGWFECRGDVSEIWWITIENEKHNDQQIGHLPCPITGWQHPVAHLQLWGCWSPFNLSEEERAGLKFEDPILLERRVGWASQRAPVLWEHYFINEKKSLYSLKDKKCQMDEDGKLKKENEIYSLHTLMKRCSDFANKRSVMEHLFLRLSHKADPNLSILTSPKYHCKVVGEGI